MGKPKLTWRYIGKNREKHVNPAENGRRIQWTSHRILTHRHGSGGQLGHLER
jgi:hypothetical protein